MQQYSEYKDSGVQWLGEIPSHWDVKPLKHVATYNDEVLLETEKKDRQIKYIEIGDVNNVSGVKKYTEYEFKDAPSRARRITHKGDVIVSTVRTYLKAITSIEDDGFIVSTGFTVLRANKVKKIFLKYYLLSDSFINEVISLSVGTSYPAINSGELVAIKMPVPSACEQENISVYLDEVTSKIDKAIAQQQKMIDLLNERKQIIINNAVTKGLNPNVKMKDSGVEWIGEIPEHWEVRRLKHIAKLQSGETISSDYFTEDGYPVFGGNGFRGFTNRYTNEGDYVLIGRQGALCGNVNYAYGRFYASEHAVVVYPYKLENIVWLGEVIRASNLNQYSQSAAQPGLAVSLIQNICYPYPPYEEREKIALFIERQIKAIEDVVKNYQRQIFLLQERKQIIINDVVTGKVKVV